MQKIVESDFERDLRILDEMERAADKKILDLAKSELKKGSNANLELLVKGFVCYQKHLGNEHQRNYIYRTTHPEEFEPNRYKDPQGWAMAQFRACKVKEKTLAKKPRS